jgi:NAD(P)H-nitrite reductase large subunit
MQHIVIIGNGISGITAARHIRKKSDFLITVVSAETDHFFSRTALMYIFMGHMKYEHTKPYEDYFWKKNRIELKRGFVENIDTETQLLHFSGGEQLAYDKLILASGSKPNKFGWPGQDLKGVQGLYSFQDLESMEANTKGISRAVIVGGGLIGIEMAEMLLSRKIPVTFLVREANFWDNVLPKEEAEMIGRHIREHHIDLKLSTELKEIVSDKSGRVKAIITGNDEEIPCEFVGLTAGVTPNIDFLRTSNLELGRGILVDEFLKTSADNVYAIGDCAEFKTPIGERKPIEQVWYTGRMMGEALAETICNKETAYKPGVWFNSAKFLDIEYQTYGWVWPKARETESVFYWEYAGGKKSFRIVFDTSNQQVLGINVFGLRFSHEVCDDWLKNNKSIQHVMENLAAANFDPEFSKGHEAEIIESFNESFPQLTITKKKKRFALFG